MTHRQDQRVPIPNDSVVFFGDAIAYALMGSMYAVTTDGGTSWVVWDAERDFELGRWCDRWVIGHVEIGTNGKGTMNLSPRAQLSETVVLYTSDFGRHWRSEQ